MLDRAGISHSTFYEHYRDKNDLFLSDVDEFSAADFANFNVPGADGLAWHAALVEAGERHYDGYGATGNGGQLLIVLPALDLVAVFTGGNYGQSGIWGHWREQDVGNAIVPAIVSNARK